MSNRQKASHCIPGAATGDGLTQAADACWQWTSSAYAA